MDIKDYIKATMMDRLIEQHKDYLNKIKYFDDTEKFKGFLIDLVKESDEHHKNLLKKFEEL